MDAALGGEQAVGVLALGDEARRLDAGLLALGRLGHLDVEAAALGPAQVHPQKHLGPVLRVGAASAGADRHHRVAVVVLAAEQPRLLELGEPRLDRRQLRIELGRHLAVLGRHLGELLEIGGVGLEPAERLEAALDARVLRRGLRRALLVVPEARRPHLPLEARYLCFECWLGQR